MFSRLHPFLVIRPTWFTLMKSRPPEAFGMVELVVTAEQAKLLADASESVEIVDAQGNRLGFFARRFSDHEVSIAAGRAASGDAGRSTGEVLERLTASVNRRCVTR